MSLCELIKKHRRLCVEIKLRLRSVGRFCWEPLSKSPVGLFSPSLEGNNIKFKTDS